MYLVSFPFIRPQCLFLASPIVLYHRIGRVQHVLGGTVILLQLNDRRLGIHFFKIKNIPDIRPPEFVDRLVVIAYYAKIPVFIRQKTNKFKLHRIRILVFVYHQISEPILITGQYFGAGFKQFHRFHDQIVKIQRIAFSKRLLVFHISPGNSFPMKISHRLYLVILRGYKLILRRGYGAQNRPLLQHLRIDLQTLAHILHHRFLVIHIIYGEIIVKSYPVYVPAKNPHTCRVKCGHPDLVRPMPDNGIHTFPHLSCRFIGKSNCHNVVWAYAYLIDQISDPVRQNPGLPAARPR